MARQNARDDTRKVDRRAALGIWASSLMSVTAACSSPGVTEVDTPEGKVLQLQKDDFLVLVSGFRESYQPGDRIVVHVIINNQSSRFATARIRTRLLGRGQQAVAEAEVVSVNIKPMDATPTERTVQVPSDLPSGQYTLQVELPPWSFEGRQAGGGSLTTGVHIGA